MANIDNLFARISELNLTAKKVSDATGISTGNLSDWKSGRCLPSADKLEKLANFLNCSVDYLLGRTDNPEVNKGGANMADPIKIQESKDRYLKEKVDRFQVTVPKGQKAIIQAYAKAQGKSLNAYVVGLIADDMGLINNSKTNK